jgi:hypothetical protein
MPCASPARRLSYVAKTAAENKCRFGKTNGRFRQDGAFSSEYRAFSEKTSRLFGKIAA